MNCHSERSEESRKIKCFSQALYFFALLFILGACSSAPSADKEAPAVNEMKAGKFKIVLPENHDEGYLWKLTREPNKSLIDNMGPVWHGNEKGIYFRFIALKSGTDTLSFTLYKTDKISKQKDSVKTSVYIIKIAD